MGWAVSDLVNEAREAQRKAEADMQKYKGERLQLAIN